jgi:hypothetical protein
MSQKVDTSLPGVEYDEDYDEIDIDHEMFTDVPDVVVERSRRSVHIFEQNGIIVAVEVCGESVDYVSTYNVDKVSVEAVAKYYAQHKDWTVEYASGSVDLEEGDSL